MGNCHQLWVSCSKLLQPSPKSAFLPSQRSKTVHSQHAARVHSHSCPSLRLTGLSHPQQGAVRKAGADPASQQLSLHGGSAACSVASPTAVPEPAGALPSIPTSCRLLLSVRASICCLMDVLPPGAVHSKEKKFPPQFYMSGPVSIPCACAVSKHACPQCLHCSSHCLTHV